MKPPWVRHIDFSAEDTFEILEEANVVKQRRVAVEIHEQVKVTFCRCLGSSHGTEDSRITCPIRFEGSEQLLASRSEYLPYS